MASQPRLIFEPESGIANIFLDLSLSLEIKVGDEFRTYAGAVPVKAYIVTRMVRDGRPGGGSPMLIYVKESENQTNIY